MPTASQTLGLTTLAEVGSLVPADVFSTQVLEALYDARILAGIITAVREDLTGEAGNVVQVPYMDRRTAQGPIAPGVCLDAVGTTVGTYPITLAKYGDYDLIQNEVFEDQDAFTQADFTRALSEGLAEKADRLVYAALIAAAATTDVDLAAAGTLTDFFAKVVTVIATMQAIPGIRPDYIILSPSQSAFLLQSTETGVRESQVVVQNGRVTSIAGLNVVVVPWANANANTGNMVQAVIIDSRRAIGEAWGRRPEVIVDRLSKAECDQTKVVTWMRYGTAVLDVDAIGIVRNP